MNKLFSLLFLLLLTITCVPSNRIIEKLEQNEHCEDCNDYIYQKLIPQMRTCGLARGEKLDSFEDCKFDREEFKEYGSCLLGMKKIVLEGLIGNQYWYSVKNRAHHASRIFDLTYNEANQRVIEIDLLNDSKSINRTVSCLDCEILYDKIKTGERIKKMNFEAFHERYKGCFYGRLPEYLVEKLNLVDKIEEGNYYYSYNKEVLLGRDIHQLNFLFNPSQRMVDISPVD